MKKCFRAVSEFKMFESSKQASWLVPPLEFGKCCCIMMIFTGIVCDSCMLAVCVFFFFLCVFYVIRCVE